MVLIRAPDRRMSIMLRELVHGVIGTWDWHHRSEASTKNGHASARTSGNSSGRQ